MPFYEYEVIDEQGRVVEIYEAEQPAGEAPLTVHPVTGETLRRKYSKPSLNTQYSDWDGKLEAGRLSKAGFTQYKKDKTTGRYYKTNVGRGPEELDPGRDP